MMGGVFVLRENDTLIEMVEKPYDSEDLLQELLAKYPNLLAGIKWIHRNLDAGCSSRGRVFQVKRTDQTAGGSTIFSWTRRQSQHSSS
jgi:hypothetical protein